MIRPSIKFVLLAFFSKTCDHSILYNSMCVCVTFGWLIGRYQWNVTIICFYLFFGLSHSLTNDIFFLSSQSRTMFFIPTNSKQNIMIFFCSLSRRTWPYKHLVPLMNISTAGYRWLTCVQDADVYNRSADLASIGRCRFYGLPWTMGICGW